MTKINSMFIKDNVTCQHCNSSNLKRSHKQTFKSGIDENLNFKEQKLEWRQFTCSDCNYTTNVLNNENDILSIEYFPVTPFSSFDFCVEIMDYFFSFCLFYKDNVKGEIIEDDVDYNIFMFERFFLEHHIKAENTMENCWEVLFDKNYYNFDNFEDGLSILKSILEKTGSKFNKNLIMDDEVDISDFTFQNDSVFF